MNIRRGVSGGGSDLLAGATVKDDSEVTAGEL